VLGRDRGRYVAPRRNGEAARRPERGTGLRRARAAVHAARVEHEQPSGVRRDVDQPVGYLDGVDRTGRGRGPESGLHFFGTPEQPAEPRALKASTLKGDTSDVAYTQPLEVTGIA